MSNRVLRPDRPERVHLPEGGAVMHAATSVTCSTAMYGAKLAAAKRATRATAKTAVRADGGTAIAPTGPAGQAEMAELVRSGLAARKAGNLEAATRMPGRAVRLAVASGNDEVVKRLSRIVQVVNAREGEVRLRLDVAEVDAEMAAVRSTKTVRVRKGEEH